jgi:two-component system sensor histidine kinase RegB
MSTHTEQTSGDTARRNLQRLFLLRNITILAVVTGTLLATGVYGVVLPQRQLIVIICLLIGLNVLTRLRLKAPQTVTDTELFLQMLLDVAGISAVFYYTGGATNPFVWFFLLPLIIAATILPRVYTWIMAALTVGCYSALLYYHVPLPHGGMHHDGGFEMHVFGMWLGFVMSAGFVAVLIVGMAHSLRERDRKLAEARELALKNEQLVALGTLAAGAAHELGTPLGTMAILTTELEQEYAGPADQDLRDRLGIIRQQIERCKEALSVISASTGANRAESGHRMTVRDYIEEVITEWQAQRPEARLRFQPDDTTRDCGLVAERTLTQALINILNNAADASPEKIQLDASCTASGLVLEICDQGPGLKQDVYERLGKTPVTTKHEGMGVGLYLSYATIERLGGTLSFRNRDGAGTLTRIVLPLLKTAADTT